VLRKKAESQSEYGGAGYHETGAWCRLALRKGNRLRLNKQVAMREGKWKIKEFVCIIGID
jgi:hypothetical protein